MASGRIKGITIEIDGSTTGLSKALKGVDGQINRTNSALKDVNRLLKLDPGNTDLLRQKQELLQKAVKETKERLDALKTASEQAAKTAGNYDAWKAAYAPIQEEIGKTQEKARGLKGKMAELEKAGKVDTSEYRALGEELKAQQGHLAELKQKAKEVSDEFGNPISHEQYDALQREIIETEQNLQSLEDSANDTGDDLDRLGDSADGTASKLKNTMGTMAKWGAAAAVAVGSAAVAIGTKAVEAASGFEASFAKVNTLLADTTDLDSYKKSIIDLSNETGVSTDALCESIYSAISASVDQANAVDFVASALKLAEGGFTDAATAVDVMTTAINSYGLSAEDAAQVSDYLITTQNLGKTSVGELASSLGAVIPIAAAYGVKMDDLCANTALLTKNGIATSEAVTYTKSMLNELGDSGSTVGGILKEKTGQSFAELEAAGMSLGDIIAILGESVGGDTSAFNELWSSSEAGVGALTLLKTGAEEYNRTLEEMQESVGATEKAYETMHDTFSAKVGQLGTVTTNALAEIGDTLLPFINEVLDQVIENMPAIQETVQRCLDGIRGAVEWFCGFVQDGVSLIQGVLEDAGITFNDVMSGVQDIFTATWDFLALIWDNVGQPLLDLVAESSDGLLGSWKIIMGALEDSFGILWSMAEDIWNTAGQPLLDSVADTMAWLSEHWNDIAGIIQTAFEILWDMCSTLWDAVGQPVFDLIGFVIEELAGLFNEHLDDILAFFQGAMEGIRDTWENHLKPVFDAIGSFLKEQLAPAFEFVFKTFIEPLIENVFDAIGRFWNNTLKPVFDGICDFLTGVFTGSWDQALTGILNIVTGIFNGIKDAVEKPMDLVRDIVENAINFILDIFDFEWEFPHLKLPHFSIQGEFSLSPPSVPHLGIEWYKKAMDSAMVMDAPTVFGYNAKTNRLLAGGEAGREVVSGEDHLVSLIGSVVREQYGQLGQQVDRLTSVVQQYFPQVVGRMERDVVLDSGALVGQLAPKMDGRLGMIQGYKERWN